MKIRLILIWLFNLIDTAATLYLYWFHDGVELNPLAALLLPYPQLFANVKLGAMTVVMWLILRRRDAVLCKAASWILFIEYFLVTIYYAIMFLFLI
jgi:hypothetical protein